MPLLQAQAAQKAEIDTLKADIDALKAELIVMRETAVNSPAATSESPEARSADAATAAPVGWSARFGPDARLVLGTLIALAAVIGIHWFLVIRHDVAVAVFRASAMAAPLVVSLAIPGLWRARSGLLAAASAALGIVGVLAMSYGVSRQDHTPVLPTTASDLYEMAEFAVAIGLSFLCGALVLRAIDRMREAKPHQALIKGVRGAVTNTDTKKLNERAELLQHLTEAAVPVTAAAGALFAGFRALFGG